MTGIELSEEDRDKLIEMHKAIFGFYDKEKGQFFENKELNKFIEDIFIQIYFYIEESYRE